MSDIPRVCATCQHFHFDAGSPHYSEWTPGSDCAIWCGKSHWSVDTTNETEQGYRRKQLTALTCPDYVLVEMGAESAPDGAGL